MYAHLEGLLASPPRRIRIALLQEAPPLEPSLHEINDASWCFSPFLSLVAQQPAPLVAHLGMLHHRHLLLLLISSFNFLHFSTPAASHRSLHLRSLQASADNATTTTSSSSSSGNTDNTTTNTNTNNSTTSSNATTYYPPPNATSPYAMPNPTLLPAPQDALWLRPTEVNNTWVEQGYPHTHEGFLLTNNATADICNVTFFLPVNRTNSTQVLSSYNSVLSPSPNGFNVTLPSYIKVIHVNETVNFGWILQTLTSDASQLPLASQLNITRAAYCQVPSATRRRRRRPRRQQL